MENQTDNQIIDSLPEEARGMAKEVTIIAQGQETMLTDKFIEQAGKQIELRSKLLMLGLKALKPHDFQDFDDKPYLEGEGAARIMAVVRGFQVGEPKFIVENIAPHYFVECEIPIAFMGAKTVALGDCSTADVFFTGREGNGGRYGRYKTQTGSEIMAARLLLGDAKKKARENAISRGICELLGLKGLSWDDLAQLGFNKSQAGAKIAFKQGSQGAEAPTLTVSGAAQAAKGSIINIRGKIIDCKERVIKGSKTITDYTITDGQNKIKVSKWGSTIEGLKAEQIIFAEKVTVGEYQGSKQYLATEISIVGAESEVTNGNADINA